MERSLFQEQFVGLFSLNKPSMTQQRLLLEDHSSATDTAVPTIEVDSPCKPLRPTEKQKWLSPTHAPINIFWKKKNHMFSRLED